MTATAAKKPAASSAKATDAATKAAEAATKAAEKAQAEATQNIEAIVENGRKVLDQMVQNGNASYDKVVATSKEQVEKVMAIFEDAKAVNEGNVDAIIATGNATVKALETLSSELTSYGKQTWEDNVAAAKATMNAKSVQEAFDLQRDFAKASFDGFVAQANKLGEMLPQLAKDSVEPINAQAKVAYDKFVKSAA